MLKVKNRLYICVIDCLMAHYKIPRLSTPGRGGIVLVVGPKIAMRKRPFNLIPDF